MADENEKLLSKCRKIGSSTWSDALDACGISGVVTGLAKRSGEGRFAGFAVTARQTSGERGDFPRNQFGVGSIINAVGPGEALMIDLGGANISTFGGLAALATLRRGAAGVVIDGACRDVDEIEGHGLWLASRHVTPTTGKTRLRLEGINDPVTIGGIEVRPGDLVVGDPTGIVVVPRQELERVLTEAERMLEMDMKMESAIEGGASFTDAAADADYIR